MKGSQVTIKDIAKELGISASTVSRALKDHPDISVETKRMVNDLAKKLRYKPNAVALSLKSSRTNTIGVIIPEIVHYFFSSVISGVEDVAYEAGYNVMIFQSNEKYEREVTNAQALLSNRTEGVMVSVSKETHNFEHLHMLEDSGIPLVFFDRIATGFTSDKVIIDDHKAAYTATQHLVKTGCKRIAHLAAPQNLAIGEKRLEGYKDALRDGGLPYKEEYVYPADSVELAENAIEYLMHLPEPPDGIFANNDLTAIGAMKALQRREYRVPEDVSIMGFSAGRFSDFTTPKLSSVDQHGYEMGAEATRILLKRIANPNYSYGDTKVVDTNLVIRESTRSI
ncbi:LacI family DNA-binding transcriptional regulator [Prolixibacter sp. NT017]|uniref:LacI family DNA-binding transcriptional regulator n=1 Tax=Prolixibacter sp. NT017 TaxID=2652390 RepID=UPI00128A945A|nr:LacI family DNA-binding transcriptional regulator [Prolixibacter sp. NT017]GET27275.1 LacI family transcriptional regulator [Prolixibacter sp. NT017]